MDMSKIFCVDLTKYNADQLSKICGIIGLNDGCLQSAKKLGVKRVYFDHGARLLVGELVRDGEAYLRHYKNFIITEEYAHLSKKEKDKLLKMEPYPFNTKKSGKNEFFEDAVEEEIEYVPTVLELDDILDKILEYGIDSLSEEEKEFLDEESKK